MSRKDGMTGFLGDSGEISENDVRISSREYRAVEVEIKPTKKPTKKEKQKKKAKRKNANASKRNNRK